MNVITILIDSLNRHLIGPYGGEVPTPNLDRLASRSVVFDEHFVGSTPCMPARRDLMTGRQEFLWRPWGPLEPFDHPIALRAREAGAVTGIITDHYHYWEYSAHGYFEFFNSVDMIRGNELDMVNVEPLPSVPRWAQNIDRFRPQWGSHYYNNVKDFKQEDDFFSPRTLASACNWLDANHSHEKFMLWVESFDPHEPFHIPEPYASMFTDEKRDDFNCWPPYQTGYHGHVEDWWKQASDRDVAYVRSQYKGMLAMIDAHLGKLLDKLDAYHLWGNTMVVLTTDHGHELGEKQRFGKQPPNYDLSAHIPLMISLPGAAPGRRQALTQTTDLYPTILEALEADPACHDGRSLLPLVRGEVPDHHRDALMYGEFGAGATVTDGHYTYHTGWDPDAPLYNYCATMLLPCPEAEAGKFIPDVDCPVWKIPARNSAPIEELLFDRRTDPEQDHNILDASPEIRRHMRQVLRSLMDQTGAPPEQYHRLMLDRD